MSAAYSAGARLYSEYLHFILHVCNYIYIYIWSLLPHQYGQSPVSKSTITKTIVETIFETGNC